MSSLSGMAITQTTIICSRNTLNKIVLYFMQVVVNHYYLNNCMIQEYAKISLMLIMRKLYFQYIYILVIGRNEEKIRKYKTINVILMYVTY